MEAYRKTAATKSDLERTDLAKEKTGVFSGSHAVNPVNGARVPIWIADYVLMGYGTGAIMAVPGQDQRDWDFARIFNLPIVRTVQPPAGFTGEAYCRGRTGHQQRQRGSLPQRTRSRSREGKDHAPGWSGRASASARSISSCATGSSRASATGASRSPSCGWSEADYRRAARPSRGAAAKGAGGLHPGWPHPLCAGPAGKRAAPAAARRHLLPALGHGREPAGQRHRLAGDLVRLRHRRRRARLAAASPRATTWIRARRETNTMPQWAGSCWYYLRYLDPHNPRAIADRKLLEYWGMPDLYVGGAEHAVLHLLYARFWHMFLHDLGVVPQPEPFRKLFHQGIILGEDGEKMSKSRGNVVNPDAVIRDYGTDTLRLYLMFLGPLEAMKPWNPRGIEGVFRFLKKSGANASARTGGRIRRSPTRPPIRLNSERLLHETIKKVGDDIEALRFNTAISADDDLRERAAKGARRSAGARCSRLCNCWRHLRRISAEELWARLGSVRQSRSAVAQIRCREARGRAGEAGVPSQWPLSGRPACACRLG